MSINYRVLRKEIASQSAKVVTKAEPILSKRFDEKRDEFLTAFDQHDVTVEIRGGPTWQESILGYGNLFSFLGFGRDDKPITPLRAWLKKTIKRDGEPRVQVDGGAIYLRQNVTVPTLDEVNQAANETAPLKWAGGRGWTDLVEKGITGFTRYLSIYGGRKRRKQMDNPPSRSGTAIQVKTKNLREGSTGRIPYLSGLLADLRASISQNRR